jgi:hypothetical protein
MGRTGKLLVGLIAVLLLAWLHHGPLGNGERFIDGVEARAGKVVADTNVPGVQVRMTRDPLSRAAMLSGPADSFQRNGMGSFKGLTARVSDVPGVATVRWADEPGSGGFALPLLVETMLLAVLAYLVGLALAWLFFRDREGRYA